MIDRATFLDGDQPQAGNINEHRNRSLAFKHQLQRNQYPVSYPYPLTTSLHSSQRPHFPPSHIHADLYPDPTQTVRERESGSST